MWQAGDYAKTKAVTLRFVSAGLLYNIWRNIRGSRAITPKQSLTFGGFLLALFALGLLLASLPSRLMIGAHEGDLMHMLDASLRMKSGELPHLDFMTPIGILGFAPVAAFLALGFQVGKATLLADVAMLGLMLPVIWWIGASRLSRGQAYYFGAVMAVILLAVVYGGSSANISLSMYYNRWGWAITFLVLGTALFPPRRMLAEAVLAPLVIGLGMAALAMLKMTFFVPLAPAVILILLLQKQGKMLLAALLAGLLAGGVLLAMLGLDFFLAYLEDLMTITREDSARINTGTSLADVLASPARIGASFILFAALMIFRKSGRMHQGVAVFILAPAFAYITYQNWGNDPKWLLFLVLYIWANLPERNEKTVFLMPARQGALALIVAAATMAFPSMWSMATTALRAGFGGLGGNYAPLVLNGNVSDIWLPAQQLENIVFNQAPEGWPTLEPGLEPVVINGFTFPDCKLGVTILPQYLGMTRQIEALDFARGRPVLTADVLNAGWIMGDIARVPGAAPWYYGDGAGLDGAEFLAVPLCAAKPILRAAMVRRAQAGGYGLQEVYRSPLMVLYRLTPPEK